MSTPVVLIEEDPSLAMPLAKAIESRRTIHLYKNISPPLAVIHKGIALAQQAPNHKSTAPWHFYLIGPETAEKIAHANAKLVTQKKGEQAGANKLARWLAMPGWLALTCQRSPDNPLREQEDYAACCCAAQNLQLFLWSQGIGMKWGTGAITRDQALFDLLGIDAKKEFLVGLFSYGYPAEIPDRKQKATNQMVTALP